MNVQSIITRNDLDRIANRSYADSQIVYQWLKPRAIEAAQVAYQKATSEPVKKAAFQALAISLAALAKRLHTPLK